MMTASFYVCWTPYEARAIFELFGAVPSAHLSVLVLLFAKLGVIINPIMYIFSNKEVRFSSQYTYHTVIVLNKKFTKLHIIPP